MPVVVVVVVKDRVQIRTVMASAVQRKQNKVTVRSEEIPAPVVLPMMPMPWQQYRRHYRTSMNPHEKKTKRRKVRIKQVRRCDKNDPIPPPVTLFL